VFPLSRSTYPAKKAVSTKGVSDIKPAQLISTAEAEDFIKEIAVGG